MESVCWTIMSVAQERLRKVSFDAVGDDSIRSIPGGAIVIWKDALAPDRAEGNYAHVQSPGLVITPPKRIVRRPMAGTNGLDDVLYPVLVQLVADDGGERATNLRTFLRWEEQIARAFHAQSVAEVDVRIADVWACFAEITDAVDEKLWKKHRKFVSGVVLSFYSREMGRGTNA